MTMACKIMSIPPLSNQDFGLNPALRVCFRISHPRAILVPYLQFLYVAEGVATRRIGSRRECVAAQRPWLSALRFRRLSSQALGTLGPVPMLRKHDGHGGRSGVKTHLSAWVFSLFFIIIGTSF